MHKYFKAIVFLALAAILSFSFCASAADVSEQSITFVAYCETSDDIVKAAQAGASFISISDKLSAAGIVNTLPGGITLIVDAESVEEADELYSSLAMVDVANKVYYRLNVSATKATEWAKLKNVKLIGYYKGNIYSLTQAYEAGVLTGDRLERFYADYKAYMEAAFGQYEDLVNNAWFF